MNIKSFFTQTGRNRQDSEDKYRELVEYANSIILRMDTSGNITFLNRFAQEFFGFKEEDLTGKSVLGTIVPLTDTSGKDLQAMIEDIMLHSEKYINNENENMRRNGQRVWIAWTNRPILDARGRLKEVLCIGNDITKLKEAEKEIMIAKEAAESASKAKSSFL
ncbi:MAG: PAS domain S-box protein, partial [Candidatus Omnitrophota bacterium]